MDVALPYADKIAQYGFVPANHDQPNPFCDVGWDDVFDRNGGKVPGYKRVFDETDGRTFAVHTEAYELVPYSVTFAALDRALAESNLDLTDMQVATDFSHHGARCFRQYVLPAHQLDCRGEKFALRIIGFDSYDGSHAKSIRAGAYQWACANRSVIGSDILQLHVKHVGNSALRMEDGIKRVVQAADQFVKMEPRIKRWQEVPLGIEQFRDLSSNMGQATEKLLDHLTSRYAIEVEDKSLFGGWSLLTNWSTHSEAGVRAVKTNLAHSMSEREKRVAALVNHREWKLLEA